MAGKGKREGAGKSSEAGSSIREAGQVCAEGEATARGQTGRAASNVQEADGQAPRSKGILRHHHLPLSSHVPRSSNMLASVSAAGTWVQGLTDLVCLGTNRPMG
jgi:hypothetical protein